MPRIQADRIFIEDKFFQKEEILQTYGIRQSLSWICGSSKDITSVHVHMVQKLYRSGTGKRSDLPYDTEALREYGGICSPKENCQCREPFGKSPEAGGNKTSDTRGNGFLWRKNLNKDFFLYRSEDFWKKSIRNGLIVIK